VSVAIETLGAFGEGADEMIKKLGRNVMEITGKRQATIFFFYTYAATSCIIAHQRNQCAVE